MAMAVPQDHCGSRMSGETLTGVLVQSCSPFIVASADSNPQTPSTPDPRGPNDYGFELIGMSRAYPLTTDGAATPQVHGSQEDAGDKDIELQASPPRRLRYHHRPNASQLSQPQASVDKLSDGERTTKKPTPDRVDVVAARVCLIAGAAILVVLLCFDVYNPPPTLQEKMYLHTILVSLVTSVLWMMAVVLKPYDMYMHAMAVVMMFGGVALASITGFAMLEAHRKVLAYC